MSARSAYRLFFLAVFLCNVFYITIGIGWLDELFVALLLAFYLVRCIRNKKFGRLFYFYCLFNLLYIIVSLSQGTNKNAIVLDLIQESKFTLPYIFFSEFHVSLNDFYKRKIKKYILPVFILCTMLFFIDVAYFFAHVAYYGVAVMFLSLLYLYCGDNKIDKKIAVLMLITGLICTRSKYYGEVVFLFSMMVFVKDRIRLSPKFIIGGALIISLSVYVTWEKFSHYFLSDYESSTEARTVLYYNSVIIAADYFPFGTGFGTYGNDASRKYYSQVYVNYGLNRIYGLSEDFNEFAADTYFPVVLAQFSIVGLLFYLLFVGYIYKRNTLQFLKTRNKINYIVSMEILVIIIIESLAGPFFVSGQAISYAMLLAFIQNEQKLLSNKL